MRPNVRGYTAPVSGSRDLERLALTQCGLVTPSGVNDRGLHMFRKGLYASKPLPDQWRLFINFVPSGTNLSEISNKIRKLYSRERFENSFRNMAAILCRSESRKSNKVWRKWNRNTSRSPHFRHKSRFRSTAWRTMPSNTNMIHIGNAFHNTNPLWAGFPSQRASGAEPCCFLLC